MKAKTQPGEQGRRFQWKRFNSSLYQFLIAQNNYLYWFTLHVEKLITNLTAQFIKLINENWFSGTPPKFNWLRFS